MKTLLKSPPAFVVIFAVIPSASTVVWVKLSDAPSLAVACWRMIFSALLCIPFMIIERRSFKNLTAKDFLLCALSGFFLALHFATWLASINHTSVAAATSLVATSPIFVAIINSILFRKKPGKAVILSLIAAIAGSVIIAFGDGGSLGSLNGNILATLGAATVAVYLVTGSFVRKTVTSGIYVSIVFTFAAIFLLLFCAAAKVPIAPMPTQTYLAVFAMAVFCSFGGHVVFNWLLKFHGAMLVALAVLCEPIFASTYAFAIFKEIPPLATVIGGVMIICGVWYYIRSTSKNDEAAAGAA